MPVSQQNQTITAAAVLMAMATYAPVSIADTVFIFQNNTNPRPVFEAPFGTPSTVFSTGFAAQAEFRMIAPGGGVGGGGPGFGPSGAEKDVIFGGESWTFDTDGNLIAVGGVTQSPVNEGCPANGGDNPCTDGVGNESAAPLPGSNATLQEDALFFYVPFNFLAPTLGSLAGDFYGVANLTIDGSSITIGASVLEAQWNSNPFPLGKDNNKGISFQGVIAADNHSFVITAEHRIAANEDDSASFVGWVPQWEFPGTLNTDPLAETTSFATGPAAPLVIPVATMASDRDNDTLSILAGSLDSSGTDNGSVVCDTTSCTYTPTGTGIDTFTVTVVDDWIDQGSTNITITVDVTSDPVAVDDTAVVDQSSSDNSIDVTSNDIGTGGAVIDITTIQIVSSPANGVASPNADGTVSYSPAGGLTGIDSFDYTVRDDNGALSNAATVSITINTVLPSTNAGPVSPANTSGLTGVRVTAADLIAVGIPQDQFVTTSCNPDCFDFVAPTTGGIATVVFPLSAALPIQPSYRKFKDDVWDSFETAQGDSIESAAGVLGSCPPPGDSIYQSPFQAGHFCLQLTIADGGPNDADSVVGQVTDPSGPSTGSGIAEPFPPQDFNASGCTIGPKVGAPAQHADWWLIVALVAGLGGVMRCRVR